MENKELNKTKAKKRLWALSLALITCFSALLTAFSLFAPKTNLVLAEEVEATATQSSPESITVNVTTYPLETIYKAFSVKLEAENGAISEGESIDEYLAYTIADDYSSITVTCKKAFDGFFRLTVINEKSPALKDSCAFKYRKKVLVKNDVLAFQRWEGISSDKVWVEDEVFYLDGSILDNRDNENGVKDASFINSPKENGFAPLYYDGQYTMINQEHVYSKGAVNNNNLYYWHFVINQEALDSLNQYMQEVSTQYGPTEFYYNEAQINKDRRQGDFNFSNILTFNKDAYTYVNEAYQNVLYNWMELNPDKCLFMVCHASLEEREAVLNGESTAELKYSYIYNKYFSSTILATNVELGGDSYIFNS